MLLLILQLSARNGDGSYSPGIGLHQSIWTVSEGEFSKGIIGSYSAILFPEVSILKSTPSSFTFAVPFLKSEQ